MTKDNIELISGKIVNLLKSGIDEMKADEKDAGEKFPAVRFESPVFQFLDNMKNPFPLVNVHLDGVKVDSGSATINKRNHTAEFTVDCYGEGSSAGGFNAFANASQNAWKVARIVRRILESEENTYLGVRGVVGSHQLTQYQAGEPWDNQDSAVAVVVVRITLSVSYFEGVDVVSGELLDSCRVNLDADGEVQ